MRWIGGRKKAPFSCLIFWWWGWNCGWEGASGAWLKGRSKTQSPFWNGDLPISIWAGRLGNSKSGSPRFKIEFATNRGLTYTTKDLGNGGRSKEKSCYAVNSKQKSTKNSFLAGSFLTCWLAGPFCQNRPLSTNDLEDLACWKGRWRILFRGVGIRFYCE